MDGALLRPRLRGGLCGGVALYLATNRVLRNLLLATSLATAALALALAVADGKLPALALEGILLVALAGLLGFKVLRLALEEAEATLPR